MASLIAVAALVLGVLVPTGAAVAAPPASVTTSGALSGIKPMTLDGFNPGNLISDAVFTDKNTMTEAQIQSFFNSKVSRCLGGTDEDGQPIVCLKDFRMSTVNRPADSYCSGYTGAPNESAATIIYRVSQSCGINPQVLIVMLQKEQSLVTHTWPSGKRFRAALGQGCPDGGIPCDPKFVGFFHQIYGAARQMQIYMEGRYFTYYAPGKTWNILFSPYPERNCGSAPVYVANKATSALYYYTPYQPNAAALRAGYGDGDGCSAYGNRNFYNYFTDWFGSTQGVSKDDPFGGLEIFETRPGVIVAAGWAIDPNSTDPVAIHVYVGAAGFPFQANLERADIGRIYPNFGSKHGFMAEVKPPSAGEYDVCVYAINIGAGKNRTMGCKRMVALTGPPIGALEQVSPQVSSIDVAGWTLDPDTAEPIDVHVYVDGVGQATKADRERADIGNAYPRNGSKHGFSLSVPATKGSHEVCVYAMNLGPGSTTVLGCRTVEVKGAVIEEKGRPPVGSFEALTSKDGTVTAAGWALDPDTADPIKVHFYVAGAGQAFDANKSRQDIASAFPGYGDKHGFDATFVVSTDNATVCAYAMNNAQGGNTSLGCRDVAVADMPEKGRTPIGSLESVQVDGDTARIGGWALDPDTRKPIKVHAYVGASGTEYTADKKRTDVGSGYPGYGDNHGFDETIKLPTGKSSLCIYAINTKGSVHTLLGCRDVNVVPPLPELGRSPVGSLELFRVTSNTVNLAGWALDPDTKASIPVHVYVGSSGTAYVADRTRSDIAGAFPAYGAAHGFDITATLPQGKSTVCAYAINTGPGPHTLLGCRDVTVGSPSGDLGRAPIGNFEALIGGQGSAIVAGWTLDPDTTDPIAVHMYVDGVGVPYVADLERADVAAAYPGTGTRHGFSQKIDMSPGTHQVCVFGINNGAGSHTLLGCRSVVVK